MLGLYRSPIMGLTEMYLKTLEDTWHGLEHLGRTRGAGLVKLMQLKTWQI